ncbi:MAG: pirin family protein [Hydrotalea flava]|uniref:pirin family protein n=1 Tax=Hydrotalea flava TaxID=714549 RepID=UPI00082F930B|nr:pirin-like C-terminal cupin domain-containing protein [Hydrotalea flava]RTL49824.1 MAG: pirin family protein [Sphingobacteriales bacterium]NIM36205.1 pirin family protein [Hydrotalea flava]NIM39056.1 pirin family protein [Hydrotalea flava]NIN04291.1 pirin family protein [Hydrotalea flava]NIN15917.1 pirin family protein [Hydrotalea flava]
MSTKNIQRIISGNPTQVGSIDVLELLPNSGNFFDPFLVFHHGIAKADPAIPIRLQGVGPHPHRGFSAISFIYKGGVHHQDSRGNNHVVYAGGTQWIHAGMGIIHSERVPADIFEHGGVQELLQVWINTPAAHKMDQPHYYPATQAETPSIQTPDGLTNILIPSGELDGIKGIIPTFTPVNTWMVQMKKGGVYTFHIPATHQSLVYVLSGAISFNSNTSIAARRLALLQQNGTTFTIEAIEDSNLFIGSGEPLNEPIAAHGPFVMNTQTEILQSFKDYQMGKMGVLIEATS